MSAQSNIFVGSIDNTAWIRIEGDATKNTVCCLREFGAQTLSKGLRRFIVDLRKCRFIDSTFIGILSGLARAIKREGAQGEIRVIHLNEKLERSICKLGIDHLITIDREGKGSIDLEGRIEGKLNCLNPNLNRVEKGEIILEAHEDLCQANKENTQLFGDVIDLLRKDLGKDLEEEEEDSWDDLEEGPEEDPDKDS